MIDDRTALTRPPAARSFPAHLPARRRPAVALAAAMLCGALAAPPAARALTLSGVAVQSSLGEPLRARIAVTEISDAEAAALQVRPASAAAFRAAGLGTPPASVTDLRIRLERPADGPPVLQIEGSQPVRSVSLPLLLDIRAAGASTSRGYTLQVDPPAPRAPEAGRAAVAPQLDPAPRGRSSATGPGAGAGAAPATDEVVVRRGDTASRIAAARLPAGVSLDQMLIALLQNNPQAFVGGNVNRMRTGAVLELPDAAQVRAVDPTAARRQIVAQSSDFNEFRRRLASRAAPTATASGRSGRGTVAARLDDRQASGNAPDRLTLSQGANEEQLAREKQSRADAARQAELQRNIGELQRLGTASAAAAPAVAPPPPPAAPAAPPAVEAPTPAPAPEPAPPAPAASPAPEAAEPAAAPASPPAPAPAPPPPAAPPSTEDDSGTGRPWLWGAGAALALLAGLLAYRLAQRRRATATGEQALQESRDDRDSLFDPVGTEAPPPSEEATVAAVAAADGADGDVDPIAEADVYLAYGREQQAEDILREAIRQRPERTAVHVRLLEMLAQRNDLPGFEALARETHATTGGTGPDWDRAAALGREIDPANPLYRDAPAPEEAAPATDPAWAAAQAGALAAGAAAAADEARASDADEPPADEGATAFAPTLGPDAIDADPPAPQDAYPEPASSGADDGGAAADGDTQADDAGAALAEGTGSAPPPAPGASAASADADAPMDFDLDFNLDAPSGRDGAPPDADAPTGFDFGPDAAGAPGAGDDAGAPAAPLPEDTLATKLDLAQEFEAIGDADGARTLIEEVIESSSGSVRERARRMLADLG